MTDQVNHISSVRAHLLATLADLRNPDNPMDVNRAKAIAEVSSVLVDTARVEVDYLKATGQENAPFLEKPTDLPELGHTPASPFPVVGVTRHRLQG